MILEQKTAPNSCRIQAISSIFQVDGVKPKDVAACLSKRCITALASKGIRLSSLMLLGSITCYHPKPPRNNEQCKTNLTTCPQKHNLPFSYLAHQLLLLPRQLTPKSRFTRGIHLSHHLFALAFCMPKQKSFNGSFDSSKS